MLTKKAKFIIAVGIQVSIILIMIIFKLAILTGGTEVILEIEPVDPRDPLRGDYVTFQYDISSIWSSWLQDGNARNGETVYVVLKTRSGMDYWYVSEVFINKPSDDNVFIKGVVRRGGGDEVVSEPLPVDARGRVITTRGRGSTLNIVYGIEEYFIPEGVGRNFNFWDKEMSAKVMVDKNGNAVLKQLFVDGRLWP